MTGRDRSRAVVIGGGVGGLAVAIRLAVSGHEVILCERATQLGGKLAVFREQGYQFDIGPSLITWPAVFEELFATAGTSLADELDLIRLDPQFVAHWPDGSRLEIADDPNITAAAFDAFSPGAGAAFERVEARGARIWEVSQRTFFAGPMGSPWELARRMRSPMDLVAIDARRSLHRAARTAFDDPRLVQWMGRYATYSGSSPFRAPATLACIVHLEARYGCWYPIGGLGALRDALARVARAVGVDLRTATEVRRITETDGRVDGVELADGERIPARSVIANVDAEHLYADLLADPGALRRVRRAERSSSGFVVCIGRRRPQGAPSPPAHHSLWFAADQRAEFEDLAAGRYPRDPTIYACVSSVTDPSQAPPGGENWFVLVNAPAGVPVDADRYAEELFDRLAGHGYDLRDGEQLRTTLTPQDLEARTGSPGGAIYGTSSNGRRAAFARPRNRGAREGLYLVGGSAHPGGGLPLVTMSARIVADMIGPA